MMFERQKKLCYFFLYFARTKREADREWGEKGTLHGWCYSILIHTFAIRTYIFFVNPQIPPKMFAQWKLMKIDEQTHWNATYLLASCLSLFVCAEMPLCFTHRRNGNENQASTRNVDCVRRIKVSQFNWESKIFSNFMNNRIFAKHIWCMCVSVHKFWRIIAHIRSFFFPTNTRTARVCVFLNNGFELNQLTQKPIYYTASNYQKWKQQKTKIKNTFIMYWYSLLLLRVCV